MGRRKGKKLATLTKIDTAILLPKPQAVSQHVGDNGAPVTTTVDPHSPPWMPAEEPDFNMDASDFKDGYLRDDVDEEEIMAEWYEGHVSSFVLFPMGDDLQTSGRSAHVLAGRSSSRP